jgi:hypothetical protein
MPNTHISVLNRCADWQIKKLLALASNDAKPRRNWLLEIGDLEEMEYLLSEICTSTGECASVLLAAVCNPQTAVELLMSAKSTAKRLAAAATSPAQKAAATLLYHLSVASALGHHGRKISSKDPAQLRPFYEKLAAELSDDELAAVFEKAIASFPSASLYRS